MHKIKKIKLNKKQKKYIKHKTVKYKLNYN